MSVRLLLSWIIFLPLLFRILSTFVTPRIHLTILISTTSNFFSCTCSLSMYRPRTSMLVLPSLYPPHPTSSLALVRCPCIGHVHQCWSYHPYIHHIQLLLLHLFAVHVSAPFINAGLTILISTTSNFFSCTCSLPMYRPRTSMLVLPSLYPPHSTSSLALVRCPCIGHVHQCWSYHPYIHHIQLLLLHLFAAHVSATFINAGLTTVMCTFPLSLKLICQSHRTLRYAYPCHLLY